MGIRQTAHQYIYFLSIDNKLALHSPVAWPANVTTPKRVRARCLRQKLNRRCFSFFKLPTVLR
jgi:hypothetical protein